MPRWISGTSEQEWADYLKRLPTGAGPRKVASRTDRFSTEGARRVPRILSFEAALGGLQSQWRCAVPPGSSELDGWSITKSLGFGAAGLAEIAKRVLVPMNTPVLEFPCCRWLSERLQQRGRS